MSRRAVRVSGAVDVNRFEYGPPDAADPRAVTTPPTRPRSAQIVPTGAHARVALAQASFSGPGAPAEDAAGVDVTASQQAVFAQGYAQGERAGVEVAARQLQAVHERLGQTIERLLALREELTYRTERDVVELALAMATRILHREVSLDRDLLLVMARIALDRMGDVPTATIRLHPDDEAAARSGREGWAGSGVTIVPDPTVQSGACVIQTDRGQVEVGVDAQIKELATALLGDATTVSKSRQP